MVKARSRPSGSEPLRTMVKSVSSATLADCGSATGGFPLVVSKLRAFDHVSPASLVATTAQ